MIAALPSALLALLAASTFQSTSTSAFSRSAPSRAGLLALLNHIGRSQAVILDKRTSQLQTSSNGSSFIWTIQDTYDVKTFFEYVLRYRLLFALR